MAKIDKEGLFSENFSALGTFPIRTDLPILEALRTVFPGSPCLNSQIFFQSSLHL